MFRLLDSYVPVCLSHLPLHYELLVDLQKVSLSKLLAQQLLSLVPSASRSRLLSDSRRESLLVVGLLLSVHSLGSASTSHFISGSALTPLIPQSVLDD